MMAVGVNQQYIACQSLDFYMTEREVVYSEG